MPTDTTPDPRTMERLPEVQRIPEPLPGARQAAAPAEPDIAHRPPLPEPTVEMAADVDEESEDEDADPVVDTGPGIEDGAQSR
jgi:hypothetical protein